MDPFAIGQGARLPVISTQISDGSTVVDLTAATVVFRLLQDDVLRFESSAIVEGDPKLGVVRYEWADGDTASSGLFDAEWIVTYPDGREETFPAGRYMRVAIKPRRPGGGVTPPPPAPKKFQVWNTVDTVAALKALTTVGFVAGQTFYVVRENNKLYRLDGTSGVAEDLVNGIVNTPDDITLQWFLFG